MLTNRSMMFALFRCPTCFRVSLFLCVCIGLWYCWIVFRCLGMPCQKPHKFYTDKRKTVQNGLFLKEADSLVYAKMIQNGFLSKNADVLLDIWEIRANMWIWGLGGWGSVFIVNMIRRIAQKLCRFFAASFWMNNFPSHYWRTWKPLLCLCVGDIWTRPWDPTPVIFLYLETPESSK